MKNHTSLFPRLSRGFTLIELLVVVTIIGILASLSVPAVNMALDAAKRADASAMIGNLQTALTSYQSEYSDWPRIVASNTNSEGDVFIGPGAWADLYQVLAAVTNNSNLVYSNNRRQIPFIQFPNKILSSGSYTAGSMGSIIGNETNPTAVVNVLDPWGRPYNLVLDYNYDNTIQVPNLNASVTNADQNIRASLAIWSTGKNPTNPKQGRWVGTWK